MPEFSLMQGSNRIEAVGSDISDSAATDIVAGGTNSKGSYAQLIASTAFDAYGFWLTGRGEAASSSRSGLIDIAVGAAASEQIILADYMMPASRFLFSAFFPVRIPAASRIAARGQTSSSGTAFMAGIQLVGAPILSGAPLARITTYGADSSDTSGVSIDPGAVANTKGAYSQVVASTTNPIKAFVMTLGAFQNQVLTTANWLIDIAVGAAASEQIILADLWAGAHANHDIIQPPTLFPIPANIPAGSRIAVRAQCDITDATDRLLEIAIYGID